MSRLLIHVLDLNVPTDEAQRTGIEQGRPSPSAAGRTTPQGVSPERVDAAIDDAIQQIRRTPAIIAPAPARSISPAIRADAAFAALSDSAEDELGFRPLGRRAFRRR